MYRLLLLTVVAFSHVGALRATEPTAADLDFFEMKIRPVLVKQCYSCHAAESKKIKGGLRVDSRAALLAGGDSGPALVPGKPEQSLLLKALRYDEVQMPPKGKLPAAVIADFEKWIARGAADPRGSPPLARAEGIDLEAGRQFWAFQLPKKSALPEVKDRSWSLTDIDRFVLTALEAKGLHPTNDATRAQLVRRLYFDLLGLPPTGEEVQAFVNDSSAAAIDKLVDRLLASPRFGERWGRHWLDVARYADSVGGGGNYTHDSAWRYRDYVIRSFNDDKPYDRFVQEQLAGDLLPAASDAEKSEQLIATGFLVIGPKELAEYDKEKLRMDVVDEQIDTTGRAFLALTLGCSRCHDHKFDPVPIKDYYALAGIFRSTLTIPAKNKEGPLSDWMRRPLPDGSGEAMAVADDKQPHNSRIHIRGDVHNLGAEVERGFISVALYGDKPEISKTQSGRLELARWLGSDDNPLVARVLVNRVWQHLLGVALVPSVDNFGVRGERPSHPELLDHLAVQFIEEGWSVKKLIRKIVLSRVYRLSGQADAGLKKADPENRLLGRWNTRRLDADALRDAVLQLSGNLDLTVGGPTLTVSGRLAVEQQVKKIDRDPWRRRTVYAPILRGGLDPQLALLEVFDFPDPGMVTGRRNRTTVPTQGLFLMNSPFVMDGASGLAGGLLAHENLDDAGRIQRLYLQVLNRPASADERKQALDFIERYGKPLPEAARRLNAWSGYCHVLLACNEFLFLE